MRFYCIIIIISCWEQQNEGQGKGSRVVRNKLCTVSGPLCTLGAAVREHPHSGSEKNQTSARVTLCFPQERDPGIELPSLLLPPYPGPHHLPWPLHKRKGQCSPTHIYTRPHTYIRYAGLSPTGSDPQSVHGIQQHETFLLSARNSDVCVWALLNLCLARDPTHL